MDHEVKKRRETECSQMISLCRLFSGDEPSTGMYGSASLADAKPRNDDSVWPKTRLHKGGLWSYTLALTIIIAPQLKEVVISQLGVIWKQKDRSSRRKQGVVGW